MATGIIKLDYEKFSDLIHLPSDMKILRVENGGLSESQTVQILVDIETLEEQDNMIFPVDVDCNVNDGKVDFSVDLDSATIKSIWHIVG